LLVIRPREPKDLTLSHTLFPRLPSSIQTTQNNCHTTDTRISAHGGRVDAGSRHACVLRDSRSSGPPNSTCVCPGSSNGDDGERARHGTRRCPGWRASSRGRSGGRGRLDRSSFYVPLVIARRAGCRRVFGYAHIAGLATTCSHTRRVSQLSGALFTSSRTMRLDALSDTSDDTMIFRSPHTILRGRGRGVRRSRGAPCRRARRTARRKIIGR